MKALLPTNVWRETPGRGWPSTEEIGASPATCGMWQLWQLAVARYSLCSHSRYGTCSGNVPIVCPASSSAVVYRVWQVAQISDCWMCEPKVGVNVAAERISAWRPASTSCGPNATRPVARAGSMANPPSKLACSPRFSAEIW